MSQHRFVRGQYLTFHDPRFVGHAWTRIFRVLKLLPSCEGSPRYEIRSLGAVHSYIAEEHQLSA